MIVRTLASAVMIMGIAACAAYSTDGQTASAAATSVGRQDCFYLSQISGYNHAGRDKIHVSTGPRDTYEFQTLGICPELRDAETMGFDQRGAGTICRGIDVDLIVPTSIGPRRCAVSMIRKLPEDEG